MLLINWAEREKICLQSQTMLDSNQPVQLQGLARRLKYCSKFTQQASYLGQLLARQRNAIMMVIRWHTDSGLILLAYWVSTALLPWLRICCSQHFSQKKKLEPNEINFSQGFSQKVVSTLFPLITFANNLEPDQARQSVGPDLGPNCLTPCLVALTKFSVQRVKYDTIIKCE